MNARPISIQLSVRNPRDAYPRCCCAWTLYAESVSWIRQSTSACCQDHSSGQRWCVHFRPYPRGAHRA